MKTTCGTWLRALTLWALLMGWSDLARAIELRREPYLQSVHPNGVQLRFRTDLSVEERCVVRIGRDWNRLDRSFEASIANTHFPGVRDWTVSIDALEPDTQYFYAIETDFAILAGGEPKYHFWTAPERGADRAVRFLFLGDSGSNRPRAGIPESPFGDTLLPDPLRVRNGFRNFLNGSRLDGLLLLGDNAYPLGTDEQYQTAFFNIYRDELTSIPLWPCVGNHDMDGAYPYLFSPNVDGVAGGLDSRSVLYYSFDVGPVHFVVLDPWKSWLEQTMNPEHLPWRRQKAWLRSDLEANEQPWSILVNHFPLYCAGNYDSDSNEPLRILRQDLIPIIDLYGIDLSLAGHDHTYQRTYLMRGLTGDSSAYDPELHLVSAADGRDGLIVKQAGENSGTIHIVSGTAGGTRPQGDFDHPYLVPMDPSAPERRGIAEPGSFVLEIQGDRLRGTQIGVDGNVLDSFELVKEPADAATIQLGANSSMSFASVDEGKEVLMTRDEFIERLSPFDRAARLKVERTVDEREYLEFVGANVVAWEAEEKRRVRELVSEIRDSLLAFDLPLPPMVLMIKTTGKEEGGAAYTRGSAIILPETDLDAPDERIQRKICHELFHILSRHNPALRERLYGVIGFEKCDEIELPGPLGARRITNPDAPRNDHCIRVEVDGTRRWAILVLYSRTETYDADRGGEFFDYLEFQLLLVDRSEGSSAVAPLRKDNGPWLVGVQDVQGFFEQVGRNTAYIIHPEEILADNFAMLLMGDSAAPTPAVLKRVESLLR